ncbi:MAG: ABC transporter ATP-binding protein [Reichenbachiella sp.]
MSILSTHSLDIGYPGKNIATDISLELKTGQLVSLIGQNGVGKSTLLRSLSSLQDPLSGEVKIDGQSIATIDRQVLARQLGIITTQRIGMTNMTVRELVALGRFPYTNWWGKESEEDKEMIHEAISKCKINYIEKAKLGAISDGQFQKVMIARALAQDTDFILMDEPTAHLDIINRIDIFSLLNDIKDTTQKGILISSHELDLSLKFSDLLWLMDFNKPIIVGKPQQLIDNGAILGVFHHEEYEINLQSSLDLIRKK